MHTTLPAVQKNCKIAKKWICMNAERKKKDKKEANRCYRHVLNSITRLFIDDVDLFDDESFDTPSFSNWDIY